VGELRLGALGGPVTFGGQAAAVMLGAYPEFGTVVYVTRASDAFSGPGPAAADARCVPAQSSRLGFFDFTYREVLRARPARYVLAEVSHAYHCALLGKRAVALESIRLVRGHTGSIMQSRRWLEQQLPQAVISVTDTNSAGAAQEVRDGDGTVASVGTLAAAADLGLHVLASDIDEGSVGRYWALSLQPRFSGRPTRLVVAADSCRRGVLSRVLADLLQVGFTATSVWTEPAGTGDFDSHWVASLAGAGPLTAVRAALRGRRQVRLAGAFVHSGGDCRTAPDSS
jgi:prephenate dehydratase